MVSEGLQRRVEKASVEVLVVHGNPRLFQDDVVERIRGEGYSVRSSEGPVIASAPDSEAAFHALAASPSNMTHALEAMAAAATLIEEPVDQVILDYEKRGKAIALLVGVQMVAQQQRKLVSCSVLSAPAYDLLLSSIKITHATRVFTYDLERQIGDLHANNCDPTMRITPACSQVHARLAEASGTGGQGGLDELRAEISQAYEFARETRIQNSGTRKEAPLRELEFRLRGMYQILFGEPLIVARLDEMEAMGDVVRASYPGEIPSPPEEPMVDFEALLEQRAMNFGGSGPLRYSLIGTPNTHNVVFFVEESPGQHTAYFMNVDWAYQGREFGLNIPAIDMVRQGHSDVMDAAAADELKADLSGDSVTYVSISNNQPNDIPVNNKLFWGTVNYLADKQKYERDQGS